MGEIYPGFGSNKDGGKKSSAPKVPPILSGVGKNISKLAIEGKLDPVVGRSSEISRMVQVLGRRRKNNPVLVGEPGVGKTAIVEGLASMIHEGRVPMSLQGKTIYSLEMSNLVAGTKYRGQFEEKMKALIEEIAEHDDIIVFIDELHTLVGAGSTSGSLDASNIFKPALARGEIRCIGATTFDEWRENIEKDGALSRRFQKIVINPASVEETGVILRNIRQKYEEHHAVSYSDEIIDLMIKLADRYISHRFFPDKAVDIMDEVGSYKNLLQTETPESITKLEESLKCKKEEKVEAVKKQDYELAARLRDECLNLATAIQSEHELWKQNKILNKNEIKHEDVLKVISELTQVPLENLSTKENATLLKLSDRLKSRVIGQPVACERIATTVQRNRVGIRKKDRTNGNFIFLGPTGTGKTFLAKRLAKEVYGSEDAMIRIDMSEFMERHTVSKLIGAPPGYVGFETGGKLTEQVKQKPHSLVLFDEVEKAHPDVFNVMLQILDEGFITDSLGRKIDFRNCMIIMTSNSGARNLNDFGTGIGFSTKSESQVKHLEKETLMRELKKQFSPEFLNRIDDIIVFNKLTSEDALQILDLEYKKLAESLDEMGEYKLNMTKVAKEVVVSNGFDDKYGARGLSRALEVMVENVVAEKILLGEIKKGETICVKGSKAKNTIIVSGKKD